MRRRHEGLLLVVLMVLLSSAVEATTGVWWSQNSATFASTSDSLQFGVRFDAADTGPTCVTPGDITEEFMCGFGGTYSPRNIFVWPYYLTITDVSGTNCSTTAPSTYTAITTGCTNNQERVPSYTITCSVCNASIDLTSYVTAYGPFWLTGNLTTLTTRCALAWAFFVDLPATVLNQTRICELVGNGVPFDVVFTVSTTTGGGASTVSQPVTFTSAGDVESVFGTVCPNMPTVAPTGTTAPGADTSELSSIGFLGWTGGVIVAGLGILLGFFLGVIPIPGMTQSFGGRHPGRDMRGDYIPMKSL